MSSSSLSSENSVQLHDTATKITSPIGKVISRIIFWIVFASVVILSIQLISPSIAYFRLIAIAEYGDTVSASAYIWGSFIVQNLIRIIFITVGVVIYFQRPYDRINVITSVFLLAFGTGSTLYVQYVPEIWSYTQEHYLYLHYPLSNLGWFILFFYFVFFPDGRPIPPYILSLQVIPVLAILLAFLFPVESSYYPFSWHPILLALMMVLTLGTPLLAQIYRYRKVSTLLQRQQTKLVLIGFALSVLSLFIAAMLIGETETGSAQQMLLSTIGNGGFVMIPITLAIAMRRYRLWDVDLFINRSLAYAVVAGVGALIFFGILFGLQLIAGQTQPLVALIIAIAFTGVIFQPLRRRVQKVVDRHIYNFRFAIDDLHAHHNKDSITNPGALSGKTLGQYKILDVLGKGGMGEVYKASDGNNLWAIKTLLSDRTPAPELVERFKREGEIGKLLNHPNIANVHEIAEDNGTLYMVMDYLEGQDLGDLLKQEGKLDVETAQEIIQNLATALDVAHAEGMVHRDIKPGNVMMVLNDDNETYRAILMDFGISKLKNANTLTGTGAIGTIDYMAPEQIVEAKTVDHRADIYALGILSYKILTGELPFSGGVAQVMFAHIQQPASDPRDIDDTIPRAMAKATLCALEKDPADRFDSAGEFADAFLGK